MAFEGSGSTPHPKGWRKNGGQEVTGGDRRGGDLFFTSFLTKFALMRSLEGLIEVPNSMSSFRVSLCSPTFRYRSRTWF